MSDASARAAIPLPLLRRGKVRDIYDAGDALLMVATDRASAFDVVLPEPIPGKGAILNQISAWWFDQLEDIVPNHLIEVDPDTIERAAPELGPSRAQWAWRAMLVQRCEPLPVECVVRGYLAGSAWREYRDRGTLAGEPLPSGLAEAERLDRPIFSPATKAAEGHDENITLARLRALIGAEHADRVRDLSLAIYARGVRAAADAGLLLADTKFEFGIAADGTLLLIDEVLTPDSSRYWPADSHAPGRTPEALDKQPLRDYLDRLVEEGRWNRQPPGPTLPPGVRAALLERYSDLFVRLTGREPVLP